MKINKIQKSGWKYSRGITRVAIAKINLIIQKIDKNAMTK